MIRQLKIADYITLLNLVFGLLAIYFAFNNHLVFSATAMLLCVVFDKLDGYVARKLGQESELGVQLDSLADLISFGVAPAALVINTFGEFWLSILALFLPVCGALRLARFNVTKSKNPAHFIGVPITINGIVFPILYFSRAPYIIFGLAIIVMSYLMISTIKVRKVF